MYYHGRLIYTIPEYISRRWRLLPIFYIMITELPSLVDTYQLPICCRYMYANFDCRYRRYILILTRPSIPKYISRKV